MSHPCPPSQVQWTTQTLALGTKPGFNAHVHGIAVNQKHIYATHYYSKVENEKDSPDAGVLVAIDSTTFTEVARIPVGYLPRRVAVNPLTNRIYVVNYGQESYGLSVIDGATFKEIAQLKLGQVPIDIVVNPSSNRIYVTNWSQRKVHVIDGNTNKELPSIEVGPAPGGITIDDATNTIYVALAYRSSEPQVNAMAVIDGATDKVLRTVTVGPDLTQPTDVAVNPKRNRIYVANLGGAGVVPPNITVFDSMTYQVVAKVRTTRELRAVAVNPALDHLYVPTDDGTVEIIDGNTNSVIQRLNVETWSMSVAVNSITNQFYVGGVTDGTLRKVTPVVLESPIGRKWKTLGGEARFGAPQAGPHLTPDGQGTYQEFEQGALFYSSDYGAVVLSRDLYNFWKDLTQQHSDRRSTQHYLGNPIADSFNAAEGAEAIYFERGMVIRQPSVLGGQSFIVYGNIYAHYRVLGGPSSILGLPVTNEEDAPNGGRRVRFNNGDIYWHSDTGANAVYGAIKEHWEALGGVGGFLGYPLTDEQPVLKDGVEIGRSSRFQSGVIFWKSDIGAWEVHSDIRRAWEEIHGGATGILGFPISDESGSPHDLNSPVRYNNFEHGVLVWFPSDHPLTGRPEESGTHLFKTMEIFVQRFVGSGDDEFGSDGLQVHVIYHIEGSNGVVFSGRLPEAGFYPADQTISRPFPITDVMQGDLSVIVLFDGRDHDDSSSDDKLGTINYGKADFRNMLPPYTIDNLWGYKESTVHTHDAFRVDYFIREASQPIDLNEPFRSQGFWKFNNFKTSPLSKEVYALTFNDVEEGTPWLSFDPMKYLDEGWEALFYHAAYKHLASKGNCSGMCLEAIYALKERSLVSNPIYRYGHPQSDGNPDPTLDVDLIREINIKQGYQFGSDGVRWFLSQLIQGLTHNPMEVFMRSRAAAERGDHPILTVMGPWGGNAHVVLPIPSRWDSSGDPWTISVADPKFEFKDGQSDEDYQITIDPKRNTWRYESGSTIYEGGTWTGARLFYTPYSVLSRTPTLPTLEVLALLTVGTLVIVGDDGQTVQIKDNQGRTFYEPGLNGPPSDWEHIRRDPAQRIPNMARIPLIGVGPDAPSATRKESEVYYIQHALDTSLTYEIAGSSGSSYRYAVRTPATAAIFTIPGSTTADIITAEYLGMRNRGVSLALPANATSKKVALLLEGLPSSDKAKQFFLSEMPIVANQTIRARLDDAGQELLVANGGPAMTFQLRLRARVDLQPTEPKSLTLEAGKVARIRPQSWDANTIATVPILVEIRDTLDGPPIHCFEI